MPHAVFDALIHEPTRLQLCGLLVGEEQVEFATLRERLGLPVMSRSSDASGLGTAERMPR